MPWPGKAKSRFLLRLFCEDIPPDEREAHVRFVATVVGPAVRFLEMGSDMLETAIPPGEEVTSILSRDAQMRLVRDRCVDSYEPPEQCGAIE